MKTMDVVLVNPSRRRRRKAGKKARRKNAHRAKARKSGGRRRRKNPSRRRRNPSRSGGRSTWGNSIKDVLLGGLGGGLAVAAAKGSEMLPVPAIGQIAIAAGAGIVGAVVIAKMGAKPAAAGLGGGTVALAGKRGIELYALSKATEEARKALPPATEGGALFDARARREAGAVGPGRQYAPPSMAGNPLSPGRRTVPTSEGGYTRQYIAGNARLMGPDSWVNRMEAGAVVRIRSAHNS